MQVTNTARVTLARRGSRAARYWGHAALVDHPLFGEEFGAAIVLTLMLLVSALICVPGLMAASGIVRLGPARTAQRRVGHHPGDQRRWARDLGAELGVIGACWTSIVSNVVMTSFMVVVASA